MHGVHLERMDTNSSAKLLQDVFAVCKESLKDVYKLCGGMPLIHIHCMRLLKNDFNAKVLVEQLTNDPIVRKKNFFHDSIIHRNLAKNGTANFSSLNRIER